MLHASRRTTLLSTLLGLCALAALAIFITTNSGSAGATDQPDVEPGALAVLGSDAEAVRESLPSDAKAWLGEVEASEIVQGTHVTSVGVAQPSDDRQVLIVGMEESICAYLVQGGPFFCTEMVNLERGQALVVKPGCVRHLVMGVVPNGVSELSAAVDGQAAGTIPVVSNAYVAELPTAKTTLVGMVEGHQFQIEVPLDRTPTNC